MTYLDNGATTLRKPPQVYQAAAQAMRRLASPGRGGYPAAMEAAEAVYRCRELAGRLFEAEPEQVAFTMNATHALNIAIKSLVGPGDAVVVSGFEHNAVMRPLHALGAQVTAAGRRLFDPADTLQDFEQAVTAETKAVVCTHVSNVFGYRLPIEEIAALCARRGVPLIVDAAQSAGALPVSLKALNAAFIAMPGHKGLYGPQGTGILLCGRAPKPLLEGGTGSQSRLYSMPADPPDAAEAGTHNVPGICGLAAGIAYVLRRTPAAILRREQALLRQLTERLSGLDGLRLYCGPEQTGVLSVTAAGVDCEAAAAQLARRGVAVRAGLHCAPLAHESAGTLESGTIRLSFSDFNAPEDVRRAAWALEALL